MEEPIYFVIVVIATISSVVAIWWVGRELLSDQPEMGVNINHTGIKLIGLFIPGVGQLMGLYYIFFGPTRNRSEKRISEWLNALEPSVIAEQLDEQIKLSSVQRGLRPIQNLRDDLWFKEHWIDQSPKERVALIKKNKAPLLVNIRKYLSSFWVSVNSSQGVSDWAMALRDTVDHNASTMAKGVYDGL